MDLKLVGVSLAVFVVICLLLIRRNRGRPDHHDIFRALAAELGGTFSRRALGFAGRVTVSHGSWQIQLEQRTEGHGASVETLRSAGARFQAAVDFSLSLEHHRSKSLATATLGASPGAALPDLDGALAAAYRARASDTAAATEILRDPTVRALLVKLAHEDGHLSVSARGGDGAVAYEDVDAPLALERLRDMHALVAASLARLVAAGIART